MKLAILSDIHSNLVALEAVLADLNKQQVDRIIIAGDHVGDGPCPAGVVARIRQLDCYLIKGNREQYLKNYHSEKSKWQGKHQVAVIVWTYQQLSDEELQFLWELPEQLVVNLEGSKDIRVVHGSPLNISQHLYPDKHPERLKKALQVIEEKVLVCGHTHQPWHKVVDEKLVINPGSTGFSFKESCCAEYAILKVDGGKYDVEHRQVRYDFDKLVCQFEESGLLAEGGAWARAALLSIKEGKNVMVEFLHFALELAVEKGYHDFSLIPDEVWEEAEKIWERQSIWL